MRTIFNKAFSIYFSSWWMPIAFFLTPLLAIYLFTPISLLFPALVLLIALFGILSASIWNFRKKHWGKGIINFLFLGGVLWLSFIVISFANSFSTEDGFADNLEIPTSIEITEPFDEYMGGTSKKKDEFQQALLSALKIEGSNNPTVTANITSLRTLQENSPDILKRYFAASPAWRLSEERGGIFATRRWMVDGIWISSLNGYYTKHDVYFWPDDELPYFQFRFIVGLAGETWTKNSDEATYLTPDGTSSLKISIGNDVYESLSIISTDDLTVEIFEQSNAKERRLTKTALSYIDAELKPFIAQPDWEVIRASFPEEYIQQGEMSLDLINSIQPGIYNAIIWVNPGESGRIYLKAFEVTNETPLSANSLKDRTNEWVGWSDNPSELFFSNAHFTIYEGDWGKPYAARFEIWFIPDSGGTERKLTEKVFKIEGWQK